MTEFRTIDVDLEIHKIIEKERQTFSETPNVVLRRLLGLDVAAKANTGGTRSWYGNGVELPHGTEVQMTYNGRLYRGVIRDGSWFVNGELFDSPSGAAGGVALTKSGKRTQLDGWIYWSVKIPGAKNWTSIADLRKKAFSAIDLDLGGIL